MISGSEFALHDVLARQWGLTGVTEFERLQSFPTRFVERIRCDQGTFAVKVDRSPGSLVRGSEQVQAAAARALPTQVPAVIPDLTGALVCEEGARRIVVFEDIGRLRPAASASTWHQLGTLLGRLHSTVQTVRPFAIPVAAAADEIDHWAADYSFAGDVRGLTLRTRQIESRPEGLIHGEINLSNAGVRPSGELVILDWDAAVIGPTAIDLGYPLICVFHGEDLSWQRDCATAFYRAYANTGVDLPAPGQVFDAAVLHALRYLRYGDLDLRWSRLRHAVDREAELLVFLGRVLAR